MPAFAILLRLCAAALLLAACPLSQAQDKVPADAFFQNATLSNVVISPTGRHVALRMTPRQGLGQLVVIDTQTLQPRVLPIGDTDFESLSWVNEKRLLLRTALPYQGRLVPGGLLALDIDGGQRRELRNWEFRFHSTPRAKESDSVFVIRGDRAGLPLEVGTADIHLLDTRTGERRQPWPAYEPRHARSWIIDDKDFPRLALTIEDRQAAWMYLDPVKDTWVKLTEFDTLGGEGAMGVVGFAPDGTLYVTQRAAAGGRAARVHRYDLVNRRIEPEPVLSVEGFDADPALVRDKTRLLGLHYLSDAWGTAWLDAKSKDIQARVDKALPSTANLLDVPVRAEVPLVLVRSSSDREPGSIALYDHDSGKLTPLGRMLPAIVPAAMGTREFARYKARDGLEIPTWLTLPPGHKPGTRVPMVVLVHPGPWQRGGTWHWSPEAQFLASRGYAVLEPEYRGSTGYGDRLFREGWKQMGLAMQDDIADGVRWAVGKGVADSGRVCIAGGAFGGYSALMGLARDPALYQCAVAWNAVADLALIYDPLSVFVDESKVSDLPFLVGDRNKDAARLQATSPLYNVDRIRQPVLLAHGGFNRFALLHAERFRDALKASNAAVEWVEYADEPVTSRWSFPKTRADFWTRAERFLDAQIGSGKHN